MPAQQPGRRALLAASLTCLAAPALAQGRPISLVVPFAPGGTTDLGARLIAPRAAHHLGVPMVVENRPGAGGATAADQVRRATPDGQTLLFAVASTHGVNPAVFDDLPYDAVADFAPVALLGVTPFVLAVRADHPARDAKALVDLLKREPGRHNYASAGVGSMPHLAGEWFKSEIGAQVEHVAYRGGGPALQALLTGEVGYTIESIPTLAGALADGRVRALARATKRPGGRYGNIASLAELEIADLDAETWIMATAPASTPPAVLARLNAGFNAAVAEPELGRRLSEIGTEPIADSTPESAAAHVRAEIARWRGVVQRAGLRIQRS
ncbi:MULTISPECIES: Bug family tripartite tricarboxylate transporter substrate binding protein [Roseomonadaceae]|uniref:Tripartite tricarboxylate transporter substrate binding protein n=1 Tax=Falsiroseomonas oleicola TaxID=2801474 RepID=A0ABS6HBW4_9PROT|nr:tripartite tricarboxylate transporter substrate-binding protein [Roseomonas oleicola]MBU8545841.1 tripartite tricarboxylate transporter substrate binding protein [Roseomonas oleicola]